MHTDGSEELKKGAENPSASSTSFSDSALPLSGEVSGRAGYLNAARMADWPSLLLLGFNPITLCETQRERERERFNASARTLILKQAPLRLVFDKRGVHCATPVGVTLGERGEAVGCHTLSFSSSILRVAEEWAERTLTIHMKRTGKEQQAKAHAHTHCLFLLLTL